MAMARRHIYLLCFHFHLSGLVGILLPHNQEAAYSVLRMVLAVGFTMGFLFAIFLETQIQLWVAIGLIIVMFLTYTILIFKTLKKSQFLPCCITELLYVS